MIRSFITATFLVALQPAFAQDNAKRPEPTIAAGSYAEEPECKFDFWKAPGDTPAPLVVFIHGGGFKAGNRNAVKPAFIEKARAEGFSVMSIDYPFLVRKPVQDILPLCARSIQFARFHAKDWNIDPAKVACIGGSAGAGTSLWIGAHPDLAIPDSKDEVARQSTRVQAVASINGQASYDVLKWESLIGPAPAGISRDSAEPLAFYHLATQEDLTSDKGKAIRAQVDIHGLLDKTTPPLFLFTSQSPKTANDRAGYVHSPRHSEVLAARANELGIPNQLIVRDDAKGRDGTLEAIDFFKKSFNELKAPEQATEKDGKPKPATPAATVQS